MTSLIHRLRSAAAKVPELVRAKRNGESIADPAPASAPPRMIDSFEKYRHIQSRLACPSCRTALRVNSTVEFGELVLEGELDCPRCARTVGTISGAKPDFVGHPRFGLWPDARRQLSTTALVRRRVDLRTSASHTAWLPMSSGDLFCDRPGDPHRIETSAIAVELSFLQHSWSGIVEIHVDGQLKGQIDLFAAEGSMVCRVPIYLGTDAPSHSIELRVGSDKNPQSQAQQVWLKGIDLVEHGATQSGHRFDSAVENRGNPYPKRFPQFLTSLPGDALILDCGCGDRCHEDARVVNFEYSPFAAPDVYGDGHALPFADATFDFVLSQAVFEHVHDPFLAAREILRVLKPGGEVYCESAFMQPLHAVPFHFFNTTIWGIQKVFEGFEILDVTSEGTLFDTLSWIYNLTELRNKGHGPKLDLLLQLVKALDQHISAEELRKFSSYVTLHARKPVAPNQP